MIAEGKFSIEDYVGNTVADLVAEKTAKALQAPSAVQSEHRRWQGIAVRCCQRLAFLENWWERNFPENAEKAEEQHWEAKPSSDIRNEIS